MTEVPKNYNKTNYNANNNAKVFRNIISKALNMDKGTQHDEQSIIDKTQ